MDILFLIGAGITYKAITTFENRMSPVNMDTIHVGEMIGMSQKEVRDYLQGKKTKGDIIWE